MIRTTNHDGGIVVVRPGSARLTAVNAATFKSEVSELFDQGTSRIVIDFGEVSFLDSSGLGALVGLLKKAGLRGDIAICGLDETLAFNFRLTRMDKIFNIYPDTQSALRVLGDQA